MEISNSPLILTGGLANEIQTAEVQTVNQYFVMRKASEEVEQPRSRNNGCLKFWPCPNRSERFDRFGTTC
jgi:hypothetical protein